MSSADSGGDSVVTVVLGDPGAGDTRPGSGEVGGRETGEGGSSRCIVMSVLVVVAGSIPSLLLRSEFSCCNAALSI